jgi:hypothetical protein
MAPYEQSLFAVKPLIRISIYGKMLTESFADRSQNRDPAAIGTYLIGDENYQIQMLHMHCRFLDFSKNLLAFCN